MGFLVYSLSREDVLSSLSRLYAESREGQERVAVITGAAGTGKTAVIRQFVNKLGSNETVVCCQSAGTRLDRYLEFGIVSQLFASPEMPAEIHERIACILDSGNLALRAAEANPDPSRRAEITSRVAHSVSEAFYELAEDANQLPVIIVDDAHYADAFSLQCLSMMINRFRETGIMVIIGIALGWQLSDSSFLFDLPSEPYCQHMRLGVLTEQDVESILVKDKCENDTRRVAAEIHRVSGGNLAVIRGLINECSWQSSGASDGALLVGTETIREFMRILHRCDIAALNLARWIALIDDPNGLQTIGKIVGLDQEELLKVLDVLNCAGILDAGRFRHPDLRAAVLDELSLEDRRNMHAQAAKVLHIAGSDSSTVAHHILSAGARGVGSWATATLNEAARKAISSGQTSNALEYLMAAQILPSDKEQGAVTDSLLAKAEWRIDPALAARYDSRIVENEGSSADTWTDSLDRISRLLWFGRRNEARKMLQVMISKECSSGQVSAVKARSLKMWDSLIFPEVRDSVRSSEWADYAAFAGMSHPLGQGVILLFNGLTQDPGRSASSAERILADCRLDGQTVELVMSSLAVLIYTGRIAAADSWCARLQKSSAVTEAPTWRAMFAALHAEIALRKGNLIKAEDSARSALDLIPFDSWGIGVVIPLSVLVRVLTEKGEFKEAFSWLQRAIPDEVFESLLGIPYLRARGFFYYAREHFRTAICDFQSIADLMEKWGLDLPMLTPWRSDSALVYSRLGNMQLASDLAIEQLGMLASDDAWGRGVSLRVLAACGEESKRTVRFIRAVREIEKTEDRLELAYALAGLGNSYYSDGDVGQARQIIRRASQLARQCGANVLSKSLTSEGNESPCNVDSEIDPLDADPYKYLSRAERRVAALAADGYSNRQIAERLVVTISTVEQHLTRIYSKLGIVRRDELPDVFQNQRVSLLLDFRSFATSL